MSRDEVQTTVKHGLYRVYWTSGGSSLAAVGSTANGDRWLAPTNWISGETTDWSGVERVERIHTREDIVWSR